MPTRREARTSVLPGGENLGAGGIQFRRADRGALCAPPVCSAGRRADEGIGPYGIRRGGRPKKTGPARRIPEYLYLRAGRSAWAGEIRRFYFWNQRARPRSSRAFRVAWGSFTLAKKIMAAMI